jgi:hypothetical protein
MHAALTAAGWLGGTLSLLAYALLLLRRVSATGRWFNSLNVASGLLLVCSAFAAGAVPNMVFNLIWAGWGLYGFIAGRSPMPVVVIPQSLSPQGSEHE